MMFRMKRKTQCPLRICFYLQLADAPVCVFGGAGFLLAEKFSTQLLEGNPLGAHLP